MKQVSEILVSNRFERLTINGLVDWLLYIRIVQIHIRFYK